MAKIAVELEQALIQRMRSGMPGGISERILARGAGWVVADVLCTCGPQDRPFEEQHSNVSIAIVTTGTFQYRSSAGRAMMTPGSLLLGNYGSFFQCDHAHAQGDHCISFRYSPRHFEEILGDVAVDERRDTFAVSRLPPVRPLTHLIARSCAALTNHLPASWEEMSVQIAGEAVRLAHQKTRNADAEPANALASVTRIIRRIERDPSALCTLAVLARESGLTQFHFIRVFERLTGVTPHQYILRSRLRQAAFRLLDGDDKILDLAFDCGFGDLSNFNRSFRAEFGVAPGNYRQQQGKHWSAKKL